MTFFPTFSSGVIEPAQVSYTSIALSANVSLNWPDLDSTGNFVANIIEVTPSAGSLTITMPPANQRSVGQQILFRNMTGTAFTVLDNSGATISNVAANTAIYIYIINNSTPAGSWSLITFGTGTSSADSASLAGFGLKAIGITLNQKHDVLETTANVTIDSTYRAKTVVWTGGSAAVILPTAASIGSDFFFISKNGGTGSITFTPSGADTIDGAASLVLAPNDAAILYSSGGTAHWYTAGIGRSISFAFTQLVKNVAGGTDVTLTAAECANKVMTFTGLLTANINVIVTNTVSVYYVFNNTSGAFTLAVKTAAGTGISIVQGARDIAVCDATNVSRGVSNTAATTLFPAGSAAAPSVTFVGNTNTGMYNPATNQVGISAGGTNQVLVSSAGLSLPVNPLSVPNGGIGIASGTSGGILGFTGATTVASSAALSANQIVLGGGAGATPTTPIGLGTATTVLHGNAGGAPSFGAVALATDVSGQLPVANGGTSLSSGTSGGVLGFTGTGTIASSAALAANQLVLGGGAGATPTTPIGLGTTTTVLHGNAGGAPSFGQVSLTTDVSGVLPSGNGGFIVVDVQVFTANGTWNRPTGAKTVFVDMVGCGGAGGGGRGGATSTVRQGGTGGGGGCRVQRWFQAVNLGPTVSVTVAPGPSGGNGGTAADGSTGSFPGSQTSFGSVGAPGGGPGRGGSSGTAHSGGSGAGWITAGVAGSTTDVAGGSPGDTATPTRFALGGQGCGSFTAQQPTGAEYGGGGGAGHLTDGTPFNGAGSVYGGGGGGGGGGGSAANGTVTNTFGGASGTYNTGGGSGENGDGFTREGNGGPGGVGSGVGVGSTGTSGGVPGGGGGGGGGGLTTGGNGGNGGRGEVRVYSYF